MAFTTTVNRELKMLRQRPGFFKCGDKKNRSQKKKKKKIRKVRRLDKVLEIQKLSSGVFVFVFVSAAAPVTEAGKHVCRDTHVESVHRQ